MTPDPEFESLVPAQSFDRRSFLVTSLGAGFALAMQPVMAQTVIQTDTTGLLAGEVKVPVKDGEMVAYRATPAGKAKPPVVLVISEIFGVHEYIKDTCRRLAKLGYCAIAPELFARQGDPRNFTSIPELQDKIISRTPDAQVMSDLDATVAWAAKQGGDTNRLAITGFCWGGRITWLYCAHNPQVKAGVAWYGRLVGTVNEFTPRHPHRHRRRTEGAGARPVWRPRYGHPARNHRKDGEGAESGQRRRALSRDPRLRQRAARLPRRLPPELPQGRGRGRMEAHARVVR